MPLKGEVPALYFTSPFEDNTLTNNIATSIIQDGAGFIWIGTQNGLNCYNGYRVKKYQYNASDSTSLVYNTINCLFIDHSDRLWVGTTVGICVYNKHYDNFRRVATEENDAGLESLLITEINQDDQGNIYVSAGNSIYTYHEESQRFETLCTIPSGAINTFLLDTNGTIWIGASDNGGLLSYHTATREMKRYRDSQSGTNGLSNHTIRDLSIFNDQLWIATYGGGINVLNKSTGQFKQYPPPDPYAAYTTYLYTDNEDNLWASDLTGIKYYDQEKDVFFGYYTIEGDKTSIKQSAQAIYQDRQGNYWTIHAPGGVGVSMVSKGFRKYDKNPNYYWHTNNDNITAIEFDAHGNWWLGNGFNGIDIFNYEYNSVITYISNPSDPYSLGEGATLSLYCDRNQTMWIGTNLAGLQYYNEAEDRFYSWTHDPEDPASIASNDIRSITEDEEGNLWVVTHGKGIDKFNPEEGIFYHYTNARNNLANDWAFQVLFDHNETLWVATAWGLSKLEKGSDTFHSYHVASTDTQSISNNLIICLFEDSEKRLWIGTKDGLNKYNPETDNFTRYNHNFSSNSISGIQEGDGSIWVSTTEGISQLDPTTGKVENFDETDRLLKGGYLERSVNKNRDQTIFFGGPQGLTTFNPEKLHFNKEAPEVFLTDLKIYNQSVVTYGEESVLDKHIMYVNDITLDYDQNLISLEFVANNLIHPKKNRFRYKMEGLDKEWISNGTEHVATYAHLKPGKYTFRVTACNNDNVWNETGTFLNIRIRNPWWFRWWAKTIMGLCLIALIAGIIFLRTATLQKRNKKLARQVEERTTELLAKNQMMGKANSELKNNQKKIQQQSEELKSQTEELKTIAENLESTNRELKRINATKDKLFSIIGHDLKNPFNIILGYTDLLIDSIGDWDQNQMQETLLLLKETSENTYNLLDNLLNWGRTQSEELIFSPKKISTKTIIKEVISDVTVMAKKKELKIVYDTHAEYILAADHNMLRLICRNLLVNAVKFSNPGGSIYLDIKEYDQNMILFSIKDEGVGIPPDKLETLFDSERIVSSRGTSGEKGTGLGLILCKEFVTRHKGKIWAESNTEKGSTFYFTIPQIK